MSVNGSRMLAVVLPTCLLALVAMVAASGCGGDDKSLSAGDRAALDQFSDAARSWKRDGTDPWYAAFKEGPSALEAQAPKAEARMARSVRAMESAASRLEEPKVRTALKRLAATYSAKLRSIRQIDSNPGSMSAIQSGLAGLKRDGKAAQSAWNAWVVAAKAQWNANPLAGMRIG